MDIYLHSVHWAWFSPFTLVSCSNFVLVLIPLQLFHIFYIFNIMHSSVLSLLSLLSVTSAFPFQRRTASKWHLNSIRTYVLMCHRHLFSPIRPIRFILTICRCSILLRQRPSQRNHGSMCCRKRKLFQYRGKIKDHQRFHQVSHPPSPHPPTNLIN